MSINQLIAQGGNNRVGESYIAGREAGQRHNLGALQLAVGEFEFDQAQQQAGREDAHRAAVAAGNPELARQEAPLLTNEFVRSEAMSDLEERQMESQAKIQEFQVMQESMRIGINVLAGVTDEASFQRSRPLLEELMGEGEVPEHFDPEWRDQNLDSGYRITDYVSGLGNIESDVMRAEARGNHEFANLLRRQQELLLEKTAMEAEGRRTDPRLSRPPTATKRETERVMNKIVSMDEDSPLRGLLPKNASVEDGRIVDATGKPLPEVENLVNYWADQANAYRTELSDRNVGVVSFSEALDHVRPGIEQGLQMEEEEEREFAMPWNADERGWFSRGTGETRQVTRGWRSPTEGGPQARPQQRQPSPQEPQITPEQIPEQVGMVMPDGGVGALRNGEVVSVRGRAELQPNDIIKNPRSGELVMWDGEDLVPLD